MPRGDGTGPMGMGPMTGRGMGWCAGYAAPGYVNFGYGMGRGRGFRRMRHMTGPGWARYGAYGFAPNAYQGPVSEMDERDILKNQADFLEKELGQVRRRLKGLEKDD
ncbi:MAG: DUF5320 domain-containing protein [Christensenellales bacterium]|jgi:hypothetical protein